MRLSNEHDAVSSTIHRCRSDHTILHKKRARLDKL